VDNVTDIDVSRLAAPDTSAAIRSLARRIAALCSADPDDLDQHLDDLAHRLGPDGVSAHDLLVDATSTLMLLGRAFDQVLLHDDSVLHPAVTDPSHRRWDPPAQLPVTELVDLLDEEANTLADRIDAVPTFGWNRKGRIADQEVVEAVDIAREAVRSLIDDRAGIERALRAARAG